MSKTEATLKLGSIAAYAARWARAHYVMNDKPTKSTEPPSWCGYPEPDHPDLGCWSLMSGWITRPADCDECECKKASST